MIHEIVTHINGHVFQSDSIRKYGICDLITINEQESERGFPAEYVGASEYKRIEFEGAVYHRILNQFSIDYIDESFAGSTDPQVIIKYPMRMVVCINKHQNDESLIAQMIGDISAIKYQSLRGKISFQSIYTKILSGITDRYTIWADETNNVGAAPGFEYSFVAINYQVEVTTLLSCLNKLCNV